jgi:hypothetical protein
LAEPQKEKPVTSQPEIITKTDIVLTAEPEKILESAKETAQVIPAAEPNIENAVEIPAQAGIEPLKQENLVFRQVPVIKPGPILDEPAPVLTSFKEQEQTVEPEQNWNLLNRKLPHKRNRPTIQFRWERSSPRRMPLNSMPGW